LNSPDAQAAKRQTVLPAPIDYAIDTAKMLVTVRFANKLTVADIGRYASQLVVDRSFRDNFSEIVDLREVKEVGLGAQDFFKLADQIDPFSPKAKRAFVVRTSTQYHAARMHQILRLQRNIRIFQTIEEAEKWVRDR